MEITLIKKQNEKIDRVTGKPIERLRVVAYARVSTDNEEQLNSYESQKKYYKEKIVENPNWYFSGIYADEGISGTQDFKRENFMKMIEDGIKDKYDMILTKSISRFARNTLDTLKYVRLLKEKNVAILFEEENINTLEMSGELLLTVLSSVAQQESETISSHVKLGLKMKSERGELVGFNNCYGYRYDSKTNKMEIIEEEAEIVKFIFQTYISGHGSDYIAKMLTKMNIKTTKTMSTQWSPGTVLGIIKNEKYVGDVIQGKTYTIDPISHKRQRNFGEADQYYIKDHHESIISREDWDKVQSMMKIRAGARENGRRIGNISRKYPFSGKIKCGFCGTTYSRRVMYSKGNSIVIWACIGSVENGKSYCPYSKVFRESLIENAFVDAYQLLCNNKDLNSEMLLNIIAKCSNNNDIERKLTQLENQKLYQETKLNRIVDLMVDGSLPKELFFSKKELIDKKLEKINNEIEQNKLLMEDDMKITSGLDKIKTTLKNKKILDGFDRDVFDALVDYIIIGGIDETGKRDNSMIRFICKTNFDETKRADLSQDFIVKNSILNQNKNIVVLDFNSNQEYWNFFEDENGIKHKELIKSERVRVEVRQV